MENKKLSPKASRILYLIVVGVLVAAALVIGLVAAFGGDKNKTTENPPSQTDQGDQNGTQTPSDDEQTSGTPDETPDTTPVIYYAPAVGAVSKRHDNSLPVYSTTMDDWRVHEGIDIATSLGADVTATAAGVIKQIWSDPMMGQCISIDHGNDVVSIYKNLAETVADGMVAGATVTAGQKIGTVGESAMIESADEPHLHFEMTFGGKQVDPLTYISQEDQQTSLNQDTSYES